MCGRTTSITPRDQLARLLDIDQVDAPELPLRWNVAPTQPVYAVIAGHQRTRVLGALRWGLDPHQADGPRPKGRLLINARAETISRRLAFREPIKDRRALLVFDGFYEWHRPGKGEKGKAQAFYFYPANRRPLVLAGLWDNCYDAGGQALRTCAIVTTAANVTMAPVHHRMPVVLPPETWEEWLRPGRLGPRRLEELLRPAAEDILGCHMVGTAVNNARNDGPGLVIPVTPEPQGIAEQDETELLQLFSLGAPVSCPPAPQAPPAGPS